MAKKFTLSPKLEEKLKGAKTTEQVVSAVKASGMFEQELSLDDLDRVVGGVGSIGGHTHEWKTLRSNCGGMLQKKHCTCGAVACFIFDREVGEDEYYDFYANLKTRFPFLDNLDS